VTSVFAQLTPVQAALLIGVRIRALDFRLRDPILGDAASAQLAESIGEEVTRLTIPTSMVHVHAVRAKTLDDVIRRFVAGHPNAVVLDLGSGLDPRRHRCDPPPGVDWYDIDFPEVIRLRRQFLPGPSHLVGADLASSGWLDGIPADRPTVIVNDGLMALLPGDTFQALARALTSHFRSGEFAFNAYTPLALRNGQRIRGALSLPIMGEGIVDPHEPENWGAGLSLIEELLLARAPEVAHYTQPLRTIARLSALSTRISRAGDRVVRYAF
jgi:O-methyltransferase involved in polyketide biosynthesis